MAYEPSPFFVSYYNAQPIREQLCCAVGVGGLPGSKHNTTIMDSTSEQNQRRGRPKGPAKGPGKKRRKRESMEYCRRKKFKDNTEMDLEVNFDVDSTNNDSEVGETDDHASGSAVLHGNIVMDVSDTPWLSPEEIEQLHSQNETLDDNFDPDEVFSDVFNNLERTDLQTICTALSSYFTGSLGYGLTRAASMVQDITGVGEKTIRTWRKEFYDSKGEI